MRKGKKYFDDYDFEEAYKKSLEDLEQWEIERLFEAKKINAAYRTKTTKAGDQLEADLYPVFASRHDMPRTGRKNRSRPAQKNTNDRQARRYLNNLVSANFGRGDIWATFTYTDDRLPGSIEAAQRNFRNYIRRVNRRRKKAGKGNIKYIVVTEWVEDGGEPVRCHHHAILSGDSDRDELESLWKDGQRLHTRRIDPDPDTHIAGIVNYIAKDPKGRKRWNASKNLIQPQVTKSYSRFGKKTAEHMAKDREFLKRRFLKEYPGYRFIDADVRVNDINGGFYIYARMTRD